MKTTINNNHYSRALKPVALLSLFSILMLLFRFIYTWSLLHIYLVWNLFLAIIPLLVAIPFYRSYKERGKFHWKTVFLFVLWLLFFPNAPYIITDLIHLAEPNHQIPVWFDALLIFSFALAGVYAGFLSLVYIHRAAKEYLSEQGGWIFISCVFILSGYGIYLGRVLRWNSWDFFTRPHLLLQDIISNLYDPAAWGITAFFSFFMLLSWYVFRSNLSKNYSKLLPDESDKMHKEL